MAFLATPARTWVVPEADPAAAVLLAAEAPGALVCMATHGRGAMAGAVLGSVGEHVVRHSPMPVILVGPELDPVWRLDAGPCVFVGIDGSDPARRAAFAAGDLARALGGRVHLLEVVRPSDVVVVGRVSHPDVEMLESVTAELRDRGVPVTYEVTDGFDAADMLVQAAAASGAAVIAVGSHGRSGVSRAALGSVSMRTVRHAPCPVLVVGPGCAATGDQFGGGSAR